MPSEAESKAAIGEMDKRKHISAYEEENARAIGELQAKVAQLEGQVKFLTGTMIELQKLHLKMQDREIDRMNEALEAAHA